jgi:hypothetical protein
MGGPESPQRAEGEIRHWHEAIFIAFGLTDVDVVMLGIDVGDGEVQGLADTQTHGEGGEDEDLEAKFAGGVDQAKDFVAGQEIGQDTFLRRFNQVEPVSFLAEDVVVEELQAIAIDLDGRPGAVADEPKERAWGERSKWSAMRRTARA